MPRHSCIESLVDRLGDPLLATDEDIRFAEGIIELFQMWVGRAMAAREGL